MRRTGVGSWGRGFGSFVSVVVLTAITATGLTGCQLGRFQKRPAPAYPEVQWRDHPPTNELESNLWVAAARRSLEAQAVARNVTDFSIPELVRTTGRDLRSRTYKSTLEFVRQNKHVEIYPGPRPFLPLKVESNFRGDENRAEVFGCLASEWGSREGTVPAASHAYGTSFRMERLSDGQMRITATVGQPNLNDDCATSDVPVALFNPAPEPSDVTDSQYIEGAGRADIDPHEKNS